MTTRIQQSQPSRFQLLDSHPVCPCGGGQSCIVDRRLVGDWVHEDEVFREAGLEVRLDCTKEWNPDQQRAMRRVMRQFSRNR